LTELSEHEADRGPAQESESVSVKAFPIFGETATAIEPSNGALDNPSFWQDGEASSRIGSSDDLDVDVAENTADCVLKDASLVSGVGIELEQERIGAEQSGHYQNTAIAILNVGRMHDRMEQQALSVYKDVALLALDFLACVVAVRVDLGPPFSALLTLWLSMIAAVGLASRSANSLHLT
jgi:hypothetical protein